MTLFLLISCTIGQPGPASEGSASVKAASAVKEIAVDAGTIANLAREIEQMSDPARARVAAGANPADEIAQMRVRMARIDTLHSALQEKMRAIEADIEGAGSPNLPHSTERKTE